MVNGKWEIAYYLQITQVFASLIKNYSLLYEVVVDISAQTTNSKIGLYRII
jgi:hypothetical protein